MYDFTMDDKLFIDKLCSSKNWVIWKFQIEYLLKAPGLWGMLIEKDTLAPDASPQAQANFTQQQEKAVSMLLLNINTPQLYLITSGQTPKEAWPMLKGHFERDTLADKLFLKKKYLQCEMKLGDCLTEHLKQINALTNKLLQLGALIEEEDQIVTFLGSLPPIVMQLRLHLKQSLTI